ncbi:hypothetical protein [Tunicatimonas pelagia]|uniref:hypothetical protein n=1 Tax=Tunicatimonas pelagia TaxID=931531 RepID=UPI002664E53B|nr:hypothetical protein [Tunicatimonas pelagia]WKN45038.1 hypothetical protein P0M28_08680 [Tunicatimonas pelagia]
MKKTITFLLIIFSFFVILGCEKDNVAPEDAYSILIINKTEFPLTQVTFAAVKGPARINNTISWNIVDKKPAYDSIIFDTIGQNEEASIRWTPSSFPDSVDFVRFSAESNNSIRSTAFGRFRGNDIHIVRSLTLTITEDAIMTAGKDP